MLASRGATLTPGEPCPAEWLEVARFLVNHYPDFDAIRHRLVDEAGFGAPTERIQRVCRRLAESGFLVEQSPNRYARSDDNERTRFLTGGWLEQLTAHALIESGADAAIPSAIIEWEVDGYAGSNEVDVIARKGERIIFVSCKAVRPHYQPSGALPSPLRRKLMQHLYEAENLVDHFGTEGDRAVLVVTADLYDETQGDTAARYPALLGKARVLNVEILSLEHLSWGRLRARFKQMLHPSIRP